MDTTEQLGKVRFVMCTKFKGWPNLYSFPSREMESYLLFLDDIEKGHELGTVLGVAAFVGP